MLGQSGTRTVVLVGGSSSVRVGTDFTVQVVGVRTVVCDFMGTLSRDRGVDQTLVSTDGSLDDPLCG